VDIDVCNDWKQRKLASILRRYDPSDVFNADETGLYWRLLPDKTHALSGDACTGGKKSKERVTVLVCANMTGCEKIPLLVIGKFKKPRCFRGVSCLPTKYEASPKAWMTSLLFEKWLREWDAKNTKEKRKIALFVDNCTAHPQIENLQSIELIFLPPNTTSELQPCNQGIIKTLKSYYRKDMVRRLIRAINDGLTVNNFKITLLEALQIIKKAWDPVTSTCIANCFHKAGFTTPLPADLQEEDDSFQDLDESADEEDPLHGIVLDNPCTFEEYLCDLQCVPLLTSEDIVASFTQAAEGAEESDDAGDPLPIVTFQQAHAGFLALQSFLLHNKGTEPPYHHR
jgi:hypothetical protein